MSELYSLLKKKYPHITDEDLKGYELWRNQLDYLDTMLIRLFQDSLKYQDNTTMALKRLGKYEQIIQIKASVLRINEIFIELQKKMIEEKSYG